MGRESTFLIVHPVSSAGPFCQTNQRELSGYFSELNNESEYNWTRAFGE